MLLLALAFPIAPAAAAIESKWIARKRASEKKHGKTNNTMYAKMVVIIRNV